MEEPSTLAEAKAFKGSKLRKLFVSDSPEPKERWYEGKVIRVEQEKGEIWYQVL
jgi:hypothetical protein